MNIFSSDTPVLDIPTTMQPDLEAWLVETLHRTLYPGQELGKRLRQLAEQGGTPAAQDYIKTWLMMLDEGESYRSRETQDRLLDLWGTLNPGV